LITRGNETAERDLEQRYDGMKEGSKEIAGGKDKTGKQESTRTGQVIFHSVTLPRHKTDKTNSKKAECSTLLCE
jgi:hypothetical protein